VSRPDARTHVWSCSRGSRRHCLRGDLPSLESGDYAILNVDGSIADVVSVPPTRVTYARWRKRSGGFVVAYAPDQFQYDAD